MNVLVTGSLGFVGKRLVKALKKKGHTVREFDIALGNDVLDLQQCKQACKGAEAVYHLAAVLGEKSEKLFEVNVKGTENVLQAAAKAGCRQFVFLSTAGVHGNYPGLVDEKAPILPITAYEKSKAEAERIVLESQEMLPITIIRSALVLGPNRYWEKIIGLVEKGFPLIGGGNPQWQIVWVDDLVSALLFVLARDDCISETFVVAEQERHSLRDLYAEIQKQLGIEAKIKSVPVWQAKLLAFLYRLRGKKSIVTAAHIERLARQRSYNTGKINALGWKAKTGMKEAVKRTVEELRAI